VTTGTIRPQEPKRGKPVILHSLSFRSTHFLQKHAIIIIIVRIKVLELYVYAVNYCTSRQDGIDSGRLYRVRAVAAQTARSRCKNTIHIQYTFIISHLLYAGPSCNGKQYLAICRTAGAGSHAPVAQWCHWGNNHRSTCIWIAELKPTWRRL